MSIKISLFLLYFSSFQLPSDDAKFLDLIDPLGYPEDAISRTSQLLKNFSNPPGQTPGPPSIRPPLPWEKTMAKMGEVERAKEFLRHYLTISHVRELHKRVAKAKATGAGRDQIRHIVLNFLAAALSPQQKMELGAQKAKLWMDFPGI